MRSGMWYRALNRIDRVLVDLTIKVAKASIHSNSLINQLLTVTTKLESILENKLSRLAEFLYWVAGAAIVAMMGLTCIDVFLRYAVSLSQTGGWMILSGLKPLPGTFEPG